MKEPGVLENKVFSFAIRIIKLSEYLRSKKHYIISDQICRSGTSIGANLQEAIGGHSKRDFLAKITISYKEARETKYRLLLLYEGKYISNNMKESLLKDLEEILKIIGRTQITLKARNS